MALSISFQGAAGTVTGSCFLVKTDSAKFLIDCGMFQGPDVEARNLLPLDFNPAEIDFVLLTHAHLDHIGLLPKLTRNDFRGNIYATLHTIQIGEIVLLDSAKIQEQNLRDGIPWGETGQLALAYDTKNAEDTIQLFKAVDFDETFSPLNGINVTYRKASHILGAASIEVEAEGKKLVFSGDLGRRGHSLVGEFDNDYRGEVDYVIMESLYGGQTHPDRRESVQELVKIINETLENGGSVFIPCFAIQRTQEIIHDLKIATEAGALSEDIPIWLDSPMAQRVTEIYANALDHSEESMFHIEGLRYVKHFNQSERISRRKGQIILAGSGMANGGRILNHMSVNLGNKKNAFIFVGYQAEATLGRELIEGEEQIQIDKLNFPVRAKIYHLQGFSGHADDADLLRWLGRYNSPRLKQVILVHSEAERSKAFEQEISGIGTQSPYIPKWKEEVVLS